MREELRSPTVGFRPFSVNKVGIIDASALLLFRASKYLENSEMDCAVDAIRTTCQPGLHVTIIFKNIAFYPLDRRRNSAVLSCKLGIWHGSVW